MRATQEWKSWTAPQFGLDKQQVIQLLLSAFRHWRLMIAMLTIATVCGFSYLHFATRTYVAVAQLQIETNEKRVVHVDSVVSDISTDRSAIDGQIELMRSASLARYLAKELGLYKTATTTVTGPNDNPPLGVSDEIVERMLSNLKIERVGQTYLVNITYQSSDPKEAALVANAIGKTYMQRKQDGILDATRDANRWLESQIEQMRTKLQTAEQRILQYRMDHNLIQVGAVSLNEIEIGEYTKNLLQARANMMRASARVRQLGLIGDDRMALRGLDFVTESKQVTDLERAYGELQGKEADLRERYGADHPDVLNAQIQMKELDKRIDYEVQQIVSGVRQSYEIAKQEVALLEDDFGKLKTELGHQNLDTLQLGEMERDLEATRALYVNFLTRLKETSAQESLPTETAIFVSEAIAPTRPVSPRSTIVMGGATGAGIVLGYLLALLLEFLRLGKFDGWAPLLPEETTVANADLRSSQLARTRARGAAPRTDEVAERGAAKTVS